MEIGISSSCFYPDTIENSLKSVGRLGAKTAEIFLNSVCELSGNILAELCSIRKYYDIEIRSVHPFTSAFEPFMFFSGYERRLNDSIEFYKKFFDAANALGASYIVLHGGKQVEGFTPELYAESYLKLHNAARKEGLFIAHENVVTSPCSNPQYLKQVADLIGDDFRMVLDIKQCRRTHQDEFEFIKLFGNRIAQVHLSDSNAEQSCLTPGSGVYNFAKLFNELKTHGYNKSAVIELYRNNFNDEKDIKASLKYLKQF